MSVTETKVREMLLPVFGLSRIEDIQLQHSLVNDLGAESLDFVEIVHLVEKKFGVVIELREIMQLSGDQRMEDLFKDGKLTVSGEAALKERFPFGAGKVRVGMTKIDLFSLLTVGDFARIIDARLKT